MADAAAGTGAPTPSGLRRDVAAAAAGAAAVAGYAPLYWYPVAIVSLAWLAVRWHRDGSARAAFRSGFAWGLGYFLAGVSWVYVSLHDFGAMPPPLAGLATLLFCAYLALFPGLTGALAQRLSAHPAWRLLAAMPALWAITEWLRGTLLTGFPWLALGYSQAPASPLAGFAPVLGVYGVGLAAAACAGAIALMRVAPPAAGRPRRWLAHPVSS